MENNAEVVDLNLLLPDSIGTEENETQETEIRVTTAPDFLADSFGLPPVTDDEDTPPVIIQEEVVAATEEIALENPNQTSIDFRKALKNTFGDSIQTLEVAGEDGEPQEVSIDDIEIDQEMFEAILSSRIEQIKEEEQKDKISAKGISDFTKSLIEIDKNGGDIRQLLEVKDAYLDPLDQLDLSTVDGQRQAVYLRLVATGNHTPEDIQIILEGYEAKGMLSEKAQQSESELRSAIAQQVELQKEAAIKAENDRKELLKNYRKTLKESLNMFQLSDGVKGKIADLASKPNDKGRYELDELFNQVRRDPEKAAKLALFLYDEAEYNAQVSEKKVLEKQIETGRKLKVIPKRGSSETIVERDKSKDIPLNVLHP